MTVKDCVKVAVIGTGCRRARTRLGCFSASKHKGSAGMTGVECGDEYEAHLFDDCGGVKGTKISISPVNWGNVGPT